MTDKDFVDPSHTPVSISNVASMFRQEITPNMPPYNKAIVRHNNSLIDKWYDMVLTKICSKDGMLKSGQVWYEWQYFYVGETITQFVTNLESGIVCRPSEKSIEFWVKIFTDKSVKELAQMGVPLVGHGWKLIVDETFIRGYLAKWDKIYSKTKDPLEWRTLGNDNPKLWNMDHESPFWSEKEIKNIYEKVMTVLKTPIAPTH